MLFKLRSLFYKQTEAYGIIMLVCLSPLISFWSCGRNFMKLGTDLMPETIPLLLFL